MASATERPLPEEDPGTLVDRIAFQPSTRSSRRTSLVVVAIAAYLAALAWTIPASVVLRRPAGVASLGGTLWHGHAVLIDGETLAWRWAPLRSLVNLGFAVDWTVAGPETDLAGRALFGPRSTMIDKASGAAAGSLLAAAFPNATFVCGTPLQVAIDRVQIGGDAPSLAGEVRSGAGLCAPKGGGAATSVPPLSLILSRIGSGAAIALAPTAQARRTFVEGSLDRSGRLRLHVTPEGARALPFLAPTGGLTMDTVL